MCSVVRRVKGDIQTRSTTTAAKRKQGRGATFLPKAQAHRQVSVEGSKRQQRKVFSLFVATVFAFVNLFSFVVVVVVVFFSLSPTPPHSALLLFPFWFIFNKHFSSYAVDATKRSTMSSGRKGRLLDHRPFG
uniref:Transmembrane protein n=1 Tax=Trypanosoma vivax (strain Y486) TaxID=1055687 RepID=G0U327_TRYVY|nr:hypothetical protein, unlikely [Trypanosoma vivax Y486]